MTTNIFYRVPSQRGSKVAAISGHCCTLEQFCDYVIANEGFSRKDFIMAFGTKVFRPSSSLGGKGGFGSLLRAIGAQIEKTTNRDACRDLSGRRLRDIKREDELKKLLALQEKLEEERKRRKKEKLENLKKKVDNSNSGTSIQELVAMFDDHEYNKRRFELSEILDAAVEKGIINFKKRQLEEESLSKHDRPKRCKPDSLAKEESGKETQAQSERKSTSFKSIDRSQDDSSSEDDELNSRITSKKDLWLGLEENL